VLTDQGTEFKGEFDKLLDQALIDHRVASADHPQTDGLAERAVRTIKKALAKYCEDTETSDEWDKYLPYIGLGYRASPQASTKYSPYELLYGVPPIIPPAIKTRMDLPIDFANEDEATAYVLSRAKDLKEHMPIAMSNLESAQHRQAMAYRARRTGNFVPKLRKFEVGDFVYKKRSELNSTMQTKFKRGIFRVAEVRDNGTLVLQGKCGGVFTEHMENCAPCYLAGIEPTINPTMQEVTEDTECCICHSPDDEDKMLLCDGCNRGHHIYCLKPALPAVPDDPIWICPDCRALGIDEEAVIQERENYVDPTEPVIFPSAAMRRMDAAAQLMDGKTIKLHKGKGKSKKSEYAVLVYQPRGGRKGNKHFMARFADGRTMMLSYKTALDNLCEPAKAAAVAVHYKQESEYWNHETLEDTEWCLKELMPGEHTSYRVALVHNAVMTLPSLQSISVQDYEPLHSALNWSNLGSCIDVWNTMSLVRSKIQEFVTAYKTCMPQEAKCSVLSPTWHLLMQQQYRNDLYLIHMPMELLDLALPLSVAYSGKLVVVLVPVKYVTNAPSARLNWLQKLSGQERLLYLPSVSKQGTVYTWMIIATCKQGMDSCVLNAQAVGSNRLPL
jgi:hypothetical protein